MHTPGSGRGSVSTTSPLLGLSQQGSAAASGEESSAEPVPLQVLQREEIREKDLGLESQR